jgi:NAD(P)-dependent dehydrogenase (short-subunit alcohol dehydrogenase family)
VPGLGAYGASKGGVITLTKALAMENTRHNVRVNAIAPGYFRTDMNSAVLDDPEAGPKLIRRIPMRRAGDPDPDGRVVVYWMQRSQRVADNPALDTAILVGNRLRKPVVVLFVLDPDFPPPTSGTTASWPKACGRWAL